LNNQFHTFSQRSLIILEKIDLLSQHSVLYMQYFVENSSANWYEKKANQWSGGKLMKY